MWTDSEFGELLLLSSLVGIVLFIVVFLVLNLMCVNRGFTAELILIFFIKFKELTLTLWMLILVAIELIIAIILMILRFELARVVNGIHWLEGRVEIFRVLIG